MKSIKLLFFTFLFSVSCFSQSEGESKGKENQDTKNVSFLIVESPPVYPGCIGTKK